MSLPGQPHPARPYMLSPTRGTAIGGVGAAGGLGGVIAGSSGGEGVGLTESSVCAPLSQPLGWDRPFLTRGAGPTTNVTAGRKAGVKQVLCARGKGNGPEPLVCDSHWVCPFGGTK